MDGLAVVIRTRIIPEIVANDANQLLIIISNLEFKLWIMKTFFMKNLILFAAISFSLLSCIERKNNLLYSPIDEVDIWVKGNIELVKNMGRKEMLEYTKPYQRAIFVAKSPEQRFLLWDDKFQTLLQDETLNNKQRQSVNELKSYLSAEIYKPDFKYKEQLITKITNWAVSNVNSGVFYQSDIYQLFLTLDTHLQNDYVDEREGGGGGAPETCVCGANRDGFVIKDCGPNATCHKCDACLSTSFGCGAMWLDPCDGYCLVEGESCPTAQ